MQLQCQPRAGRLASALALTAIALASLVTGEVAEAAFPGRNGLIAIGANFLPGCVERPSAIVTMKPDGSRRKVIVGCADRESAAAPNWSADGRRLLFHGIIEFSVGEPTFGGPVIMASDGSSQRPVPLDARPQGTFGKFSFAPDGRHFVYNRPTRDMLNMSAEPEIWRASTDGSEDRQIGEGWEPRWSPDGKMIAYVGGGGVWVMNARTGERVRRVVEFARNAESLDWAPDGRRLLWAPFNPTADIWVVRVDGKGRPRRLTTSPRVVEAHAVWSPNGRRIAFTTSRHDSDSEKSQHSIWTMSARGTDTKRIFRSDWVDVYSTGNPSGLSWGPRPR
jgi:Tol biopolymer transport system component